MRSCYLYVLLLVISLYTSVLTATACDAQWAEGQKNDSYLLDAYLYNNSLAHECGCLNNKNNVTKSFNLKDFCVRKCCQRNYILKDNTCIFDQNNVFTDYPVPVYVGGKEKVIEYNLNEVKVLPGLSTCKGNKSAKFTTFEIGDIFTNAVITRKDGKLWFFDGNWDFTYDQYCFEYSEEEKEVSAFICEIKFVEDLNFGDRLSFIGTMISLPFLLVTFIVYALIPNRNVHGSALMCYVFALFVADFLLDFSYLYTGEMTYTGCRIMGMLTLYCFISSIFWMNVMSYDIYSTFKGSGGGYNINKRAKERRRFLFYSLYAWGVPLVMISLVITISLLSKHNEWYDPGIRGEECFLRDGIPELLYFYGPLAVLIAANIVMFIITAVRIKRVQNDTQMLSRKGSKKHGRSENDDQYRFSLYIKLLFAMGVNWAVEIVNWVLTWQIENIPPAVWYITDFCNAAYGVVIFFVFVFKKSIWNALKKRYQMATGANTLQATESFTVNTTTKT